MCHVIALYCESIFVACCAQSSLDWKLTASTGELNTHHTATVLCWGERAGLVVCGVFIVRLAGLQMLECPGHSGSPCPTVTRQTVRTESCAQPPSV